MIFIDYSRVEETRSRDKLSRGNIRRHSLPEATPTTTPALPAISRDDIDGVFQPRLLELRDNPAPLRSKVVRRAAGLVEIEHLRAACGPGRPGGRVGDGRVAVRDEVAPDVCEAALAFLPISSSRGHGNSKVL